MDKVFGRCDNHGLEAPRMTQSGNNRAMLPALLQAIARPGPIVILPHDNPDPDALASAATLTYLFRELGKRDATIALGGIVGRAENRAMLTYRSSMTILRASESSMAAFLSSPLTARC